MTFVARAGLPEPLVELWNVLEQAGFWVAEEEYSDYFGDAFAVLMRGRTAVRFVRDRGQCFVEVGAAGGAEWFTPMVWDSYLRRDVGDATTPTIEAECQFVVASLGQIFAAIDTDPDLLENLRRYRAERAQARRGGSPPRG